MMIAYSQRLSRAPSKSGLLATGESLPRACAPFRHTNALGFAIVDDRFRFIAINGVMAAMNGIAPEAHVGCELRKVLGAAAEKIEAVFGTSSPQPGRCPLLSLSQLCRQGASPAIGSRCISHCEASPAG